MVGVETGALGLVPESWVSNMNNIYECDKCEKETKTLYGVMDEALCESCFNDAITRAENAYDAMREDFLN